MTSNSVYICSDGERSTATEFQYANGGSTSLESVKTTIFDRADSDITTPVDVSYKTYEIVWPYVKPPKPTGIVPFYPDGSPLSRNPSSSPSSSSKNKESIEIENGNKYGFIESNKEFLGQYLLAHQCVVNVPLFDCLKYCENNPECAGTEWNKAIVKQSDTGKFDYLYENVCCPKTVIKQIIPRRDKMDRGRFYVKKELKDMMNRDKIIMTKADFSKDAVPPTNKRFALKMTKIDTQFDDNPDTQNVNYIEAVFDDTLYDSK